MIKTLSILGFRGFSKAKAIEFSLPDNTNNGSGLNIIVGPNNSGKSTIVESINAFNAECSFSVGKRNANIYNGVDIQLVDENNDVHAIKSKTGGGSEIDRFLNGMQNDHFLNNYVLPSRRFVNYEFYKNDWVKETYIRNSGLKNRSSTLENFSARLFAMQKNKASVEPLLKRVVGKDVQWAIDQSDNGSYFVKFNFGNLSHSSEGVGDGLWSVLTICDALYDSNAGDTIVIDEPELSLHPFYQKRLMSILVEKSKDRQIIICTHSPYFIDWNAISNGASLIRTNKTDEAEIDIHQISSMFRANVSSFLNDIYNPHVLGIEASEIFFVEDNVVLTEGQEDVVAFNKINDKLGIKLDGNFFGWGSGGAEKESIFLQLFQDLGFKKVVAIFDGDKADEFNRCKTSYPKYCFMILPADDVRDKEQREIKEKSGISTKGMDLKPKYEKEYRKMMEEINQFFNN